MKWTGLNELREKYLSFFESKGHLRHKSYPLVPINDKSLLLINAGMTPLKKYFTGELEPPRHRMTTCQKCIRTPDIDNVGITDRHGTFFEMLGNFSFGDYFKTEAIHWAWEFITDCLELPTDLIWVTIFLDDDEAYSIWADDIGIDPSHIVRLGKKDNFWEHGSGPCGPCSEIHFDRGEEYGCGSPDCKPGCDCDRFMEFWNLVFTQFDNDGHNNYTKLAKPNIDTGMGLERLACLMQGVNNLFEVDTMRNIMNAISEKSNVKYGDDKKNDISLRIITDHIRSTSFMICDGILPSNEGRGYVLRRLLRRAARHGRILGIKGLFLSEICDSVAHENFTEYPELTEKLDYIKRVVLTEEERFSSTIDSGLSILENIISTAKSEENNILSGADVFKLNDTFGFPIDLTREIAAENNLSVDDEGFTVLMKEQKDKARKARLAMGDLGWSEDAMSFIDKSHKTEFTGYTENSSNAKVIVIIDSESKEPVGSMGEGNKIIILLDRTPFYAESGGQVGDTGYIKSENALVRVDNTIKHEGIFVQIGEVENGIISTDDNITAEIDIARRNAIRRNHSSAHLLQAALRNVLGNHVEQAGSYVDDKRVRFDFSHFQAMTTDEITKVETIVNREILSGTDITTTETDVATAKSMGAMALFGEKYGSVVRVVKMGDYSCELCGGTHLDNTAKMGLFKIISESSVAAGVRRIEGTTGYGVLELIDERDELIKTTAQELKVANLNDLPKRAVQIQNDLRTAKHEIDSLNSKLAASKTDDLLKSAVKVKGLNVISKKTNDMTIDMLRTLCDELKASHDDVVAVFSTITNDKINFVAACGKDAVAKGAHAGNILKQVSAVTGGKGGGRPDSAASGGKDIAKLDEALSTVSAIVSDMVK